MSAALDCRSSGVSVNRRSSLIRLSGEFSQKRSSRRSRSELRSRGGRGWCDLPPKSWTAESWKILI